MSFTIFDIAGKMVVTQQQLRISQQIDLSILNSGIYFLHLTVGDSIAIRKIISQL
jgi:hypothetical protein